MKRFLFVLTVALAAIAAPAAAQMIGEEAGERVIASLSQNAVGITADFTGSEIFVFGAVARDRLPDTRDEDLDIIITVTGPVKRTMLRKKNRVFGIWVNTESIQIDRAPSFYAVATTGPLDEILSSTEDLRRRITMGAAVRVVGEAGKVEDPARFRDAVIRLNRAAGVYFEQIDEVALLEGTLFQSHFELPSNIVEGEYRAEVFLLRNKTVRDSFTTTITVQKVGVEQWIYTLAHEQALIYGLLSIVLALAAGWGASEVFRLMRR